MSKFENAISIQGRDVESVTLSTSAASTDKLPAGIYAVWSDVDSNVAVDQDQTVGEARVTATKGLQVFSGTGNYVPLRLQSPSFISAIASGAGNLYYVQVA